MFVMFKHDVDVLKNHHNVVDIKKIDESYISVDPADRGFEEPSVYCVARTAERNFLELVDETPVDERWFRDTIGFGGKHVTLGDIKIEFFDVDKSQGIDNPGVMVSLIVVDSFTATAHEPGERIHEVKALFTRGEALQFCNVIMGKKMVK